MTSESAPADPVVAAFIADSDAVFTAAFDALPMGEQRSFYDAFWRRYHAPRPLGVSVETVMIPTDAGARRALLYRPPHRCDTRGLLPIVVYFHGGGWMLGSPESHDLPAARLCAEARVAVLSLDYRLSPESVFPDALMDCLAAVHWVAKSGRAAGLDPDRLAVAGDSAGGTLAAGLCLWIRDHGGPRIAFQLLIYPALTAEVDPGRSGGVSAEAVSHYLLGYFGGQDLANNAYAMPLSAKSLAGLPPAFIATGGLDPIQSHGKLYAQRLGHAGIPCGYTCGFGLPHTYLRLVHSSAAAARELTACSSAVQQALAPQQSMAS
ncbi:MAG: alpha/beta hydrolase [Rhodospirillaceae bacterium]|nr:alpha/beta hydrolase [Rhodospirillaceae bacterium]